jgi:hypothetical protein
MIILKCLGIYCLSYIGTALLLGVIMNDFYLALDERLILLIGGSCGVGYYLWVRAENRAEKK